MTTVNTDQNSAGRSMLLGVIALLAVGGYYFYGTIFQSNLIQAKQATTTATISKLGSTAMRDLLEATVYNYEVGGSSYEGRSKTLPCHVDESSTQTIQEHRYTVVYNSKSPEQSELLLSPEKFNKYGVDPEDGFEEIYEQFWKCD